MARSDQAVIKITSRGLRKSEKMLDINEKYIRMLIQEMIEEVGLVGQDILADYAPVRTGRLKESIVVTGRNRSVYRPSIRIGVTGAKSDEGFDYTNVTRFGRKAVEASRERHGSRPDAGIGGSRLARTYRWENKNDVGRQLRPFRRNMLKFTPGLPGTGFLYAPRVKAFHPKKDWVRSSNEDIKVMSEYAFQSVTKKIEESLKSGSTSSRSVSIGVRSRFGRFS
jgi:hypothetical protein